VAAVACFFISLLVWGTDMLTRTGIAFLVIAILALGGAGALTTYDWQHRLDAANPTPRTSAVATAPPKATPTPDPSVQATPTPPPPASAQIQTVPFTVQAPFGNWDAAHEEYCEAAAVYMVGKYFQGDREAKVPPATADKDMGEVVAFERASYSHINLPLTEMAQVANHFYGLKGDVVPLDFPTIQRQVSQGVPVIIPVMTHGGPAGRINPGYGAESVYHVIVVVGYDAGQGIVYTNDPGLSTGQALTYSWSTLQTAIQAQAQTPVDGSGTPVPQQGAVMLILHQ
jgi:hypothetical protein